MDRHNIKLYKCIMANTRACTQSKRKRTGKKRLNGHGLGHADIHSVTIDLFQAIDKVSESKYVTKTMVKITKPVRGF